MIRSLARAVPARGLQGRARCVVSDLRGGDYFEQLAGRARRARPRRACTRVLFLRPTSDAADALQGDAPPPPARPARQRARRHPRERELLAPDPRARRHGRRHHRPERAGAAAQGGAEMLEPGQPGKLAVTSRPSATSTGPRATPTWRSTCASCPTRTTSRTSSRSPAWTRGSSTTSAATGAWTRSTSTSCRSWTTSCPSTSTRARRTSSSRSAARAASTAPSRSPSTSPRATATARPLRRRRAPRHRQALKVARDGLG
jgi:hypothetical protein